MHRSVLVCRLSQSTLTTISRNEEEHPEISWSEVTRQAIQENIGALEVMDKLTSESELTERDLEDIADKINESGRNRVDEGST